jgi:hypothetical protein
MEHHARRPHHVEHREVGRLVEEVQAALLRVEDVGELVRRTQGSVEHLPHGPAGLRLAERHAAVGDQLVDVEHGAHRTPGHRTVPGVASAA